MKRVLGRSGIEVSAMGMGCWAIGGECWYGDEPTGWGDTDDAESLRAIAAGLEQGITFLDTANVYGAGHSERLLGQALKGKRDQVVISTKFGNTFDEETRHKFEPDCSPVHIRSSCEASLKRMNTDYIDLYLFHIGWHDADKCDDILETLESLCDEGKIRAYGWSTDLVDRAEVFAKGAHCAAIEHNMNIFWRNEDMLSLCANTNMASVNRAPLAMGMLTGKYTGKSETIKENDIRGVHSPEWIQWFKDGKPSPEFLQKLSAIREILTSNGRTLTQGALAWIWGKSDISIPIPGFRTVKQITENAKAMEFGPLKKAQIAEIDEILGM